MKINCKTLILLPIMILTSCSSSSDPLKLPDKGVEISAKEGEGILEKSIANYLSNDTLGIAMQMSNSTLSLDGNVLNSNTNTAESAFSLNLALNKWEIQAAAKGLSSLKSSDFEFFIQNDMSGNFSLFSILGEKEIQSEREGDFNFLLGLSNSFLYLDVEQIDLIEDLLTEEMTTPYKIGEKIDQTGLSVPVVDSTVKASWQEKIEDILPDLGSYLTHKKGIYSYSGSLDNAHMKEYFEEHLEEDISILFTTDSSFSYSLLFDADNLMSFGVSTSGTSSVNTIVNDDSGSSNTLNTSIDFNLNFKIEFKTDVEFPVINQAEFTVE